jgi:hypothetical protein
MGGPKQIAVLAIAFLICAMAVQTQCNGEVIFEDNFDNNRYRWGTPDNEKWRLAIEDGKYIINNKSDRASCRTWNKGINLESDIDFTIEASIEKIGGPKNRGYGLIWGLKDNRNQYLFAIGGNGYFGVFKIENGAPSPIFNWTHLPGINKGNSKNKLTIARQINKTYFFVNDTYAGEAEGLHLFGGKAGFGNEAEIGTAVDYIRISEGVPEYLLEKIPGHEKPAEKIPAEEVVVAAAPEEKIVVELPKEGPPEENTIDEPKEETTVPIGPGAGPIFKLVSAGIMPHPVPPGGQFDIVIDYQIFEPGVESEKVPVRFSYIISSIVEVLFESEEAELDSFNGKITRRIEHVNASKKKGKYFVRLHLRYQQKEIETLLGFEIE